MQEPKVTKPHRGGRRKGDGGRPKGVPNKATRAAREAIAAFVDGNAHRLQKWLDTVAEGQPMVGADGQRLYDEEGRPLWVVPPNPVQAHNMFQSVVEYHVPKLARSEVTGANGAPITLAALDLKGLSDNELEQVQTLLSKVAGPTPE